MFLLVCYDGSETSKGALPAIRLLTSVPDLRVQLMRVVPIPPPPSASGGAAAADVRRTAAEHRAEDLQSAYQSHLDQLVGNAHRECESVLPELPHGTEVRIATTTEDDLAGPIISHARDSGVDMIVMATHSRSPLKELFVGSVARAVVGSGVAPVVLVHPKE